MSIIHVALPLTRVNQLTYLTPPHLNNIAIGGRVSVPFCNRIMIGIVIKVVHNYDNFLYNQLPTIEKSLDICSLYDPALWRTLHWASNYYHFSLGKILLNAIPILLRRGYATENIPINQNKINDLESDPKQSNNLQYCDKKKIITTFSHTKGVQEKSNLKDTANTKLKPSDTKQLNNVAPPYIQKQKNSLYNNAIVSGMEQLNAEQATAVSTIRNTDHQFSTWILTGMAGSGKTAVYLHFIGEILKKGQQALILVPEIHLISHTVSLLQQKLHASIATLHSQLHHETHLKTWQQARDGKIAIMIGTRSVLFSPLKKLGVIILENEHDSSYIQTNGFRYNARDLAIVRAKQEKIPIIMISSTPSLETLYNIQLSKYRHINLSQPNQNIKITDPLLVDLKDTKLNNGLSITLIQKINQHLTLNNQVLLFLNRRGFSSSILCHECGWKSKCLRCNRNYTFHKIQNKLLCHHCDSQRNIPKQCSQCGSTHIVPIGMGTEKLEKNLKTLFPLTPLTRIDRDTTHAYSALQTKLDKIKNGGAHILVGTQMLSKIDNFPYVTLVSLVNVDQVLFSTNFRAAEHFAQLYTQVFERALSKNKQIEVILQTHHPKHPLLQTLLYNGYHEFAQKELKERKNAFLPPCFSCFLFCAEDYNKQKACQFLKQILILLQSSPLYDPLIYQILGPIPSLQAKHKGRYRWKILIRHPSHSALHRLVKTTLPLVEDLPQAHKIMWTFDMNHIEN
ncbi:primosomal protein N' [Candidatus Erwinia haradaeae]|uniref:Replication restart protein PriA n=1 Tax=Candidatus Erwinia haradaeae TaxID=1922217 RepID=A0A451DPK6_9GAMM|nr:primosomal protein N' [Candidatus Erwinia haradaeae]VFP88712.1 Primosomal protein N' [Candidatus Erwinia haradaeae]